MLYYKYLSPCILKYLNYILLIFRKQNSKDYFDNILKNVTMKSTLVPAEDKCIVPDKSAKIISHNYHICLILSEIHASVLNLHHR